MVTDNNEIAETLNSYFTNVIRFSETPDSKTLINFMNE